MVASNLAPGKMVLTNRRLKHRSKLIFRSSSIGGRNCSEVGSLRGSAKDAEARDALLSSPAFCFDGMRWSGAKVGHRFGLEVRLPSLSGFVSAASCCS